MDVIIKLDRGHDPDDGYPIYPDDVEASVREQPVWGLYEADSVCADWLYKVVREGLTVDAALSIQEEYYPVARLLS